MEVGSNIGACTVELLLRTRAKIIALEPSAANVTIACPAGPGPGPGGPCPGPCPGPGPGPDPSHGVALYTARVATCTWLTPALNPWPLQPCQPYIHLIVRCPPADARREGLLPHSIASAAGRTIPERAGSRRRLPGRCPPRVAMLCDVVLPSPKLLDHHSHHLPLTTYHLPLAICHLPLTTYHIPLATYHLPPSLPLTTGHVPGGHQ